MTRRRTRPKTTRNNKKIARAKPLRMVCSSGSSFKAASSAKKKGRADTAVRQAEEVW